MLQPRIANNDYTVAWIAAAGKADLPVPKLSLASAGGYVRPSSEALLRKARVALLPVQYLSQTIDPARTTHRANFQLR